MADKCEKCTEKCPQAEMAHQAALGRMYATKEFTELLKKVENGELVEVVRCRDCKHFMAYPDGNKICRYWTCSWDMPTDEAGFCYAGERRTE